MPRRMHTVVAAIAVDPEGNEQFVMGQDDEGMCVPMFAPNLELLLEHFPSVMHSAAHEGKRIIAVEYLARIDRSLPIMEVRGCG